MGQMMANNKPVSFHVLGQLAHLSEFFATLSARVNARNCILRRKVGVLSGSVPQQPSLSSERLETTLKDFGVNH